MKFHFPHIENFLVTLFFLPDIFIKTEKLLQEKLFLIMYIFFPIPKNIEEEIFLSATIHRQKLDGTHEIAEN